MDLMMFFILFYFLCWLFWFVVLIHCAQDVRLQKLFVRVTLWQLPRPHRV